MLKFETTEELIEYLNSEDGQEVTNTIKAPLIAKRDELLGEVKTLRSRFEGVDPDEVQDLRSQAQKAADLKAQLERLQAEAGKPDEKVEAVKSELQSELARQREEHQRVVQAFQDQQASTRIRDAITRNNGIPELLEHVMKSRTRVNVKDDGGIDLEVLTANGKPMFVNGEEATLEHLVQEMANDERYGRAFNKAAPGGSGSRGNNSIQGKDLSKLSISEKMRMAASNPALIGQFQASSSRN